MTNCDDFISIKNKDIYQKLCDLEGKIQKIGEHLKEINGSVKLNKWIATTALTCTFALAGYFLYQIATTFI